MVKQLLLVAGLLAGSPGHAGLRDAPPQLFITTEYAPPAIMVEGERVAGYSSDKIHEIMARTGMSYSIDVLPWKRAFTSAVQRPNGCVYATTRTPEREPLFKWVGPTDEGAWVLLGRADRNYQLSTLEDARRLRIGTYNGDVRDDYLRARGFKVDPAPNDMLNPQKLLMNRIDLWATGLRPGGGVLEQNGFAGKIVPVLVFNQVKAYLACNRAVPDAIIDKMNAALDAMNRDGTSRRIERKYDNWAPRKASEAEAGQAGPVR
ncbi:ABC transporter substrate-binding protein [Massilia sp. CCM 8734]|uniref:substrate-binding periplasmic protein n=1 Tax=Massilia sp. CCM 8734 TaxID=2609283 RepID=UPI001420DB47|nr:transporter substrate-binding domain-containing protein [Massilia sp. CCM 8734]NHZ95790.1 transporter substrate-binding domain-containing protein [Massilia sp. CCM 8734]